MAVSAGLRALRRVAPARQMSVLSSTSYAGPSAEHIEFPRKARGLDYDLNWSLAGDSVTARGDALRNAPVRTLLEFTPRAAVKAITKDRALVTKTAEALPPAPAFSTDSAIPGTSAVGIEEFEDRLASLRDECLSFAPRLFVEDGAVGSSRATQLHVRLVTDCPVQALAFRSLLQRVPLYSPEVFPRTLTVYSGTLAAPELLCGSAPGAAGSSSSSSAGYTMLDVDAAAARATVLAAGRVSIESLAAAMQRAAGALMAAGGYRHVPGGAHVPNLREVRADGLLHWYLRDGHYTAPAAEAHPDILALPAADVVTGGSALTAVLGDRSGAVAAAAAGKARLYAAGGAVWHASEGLSSFWGGAALPAGAAAAASLPRGGLVTEGRAFVPLSGPKSAGQPAAVVLVSKEAAAKGSKLAAGDAAALLAQSLGLSAKQAEKLGARLSSVASITAVPGPAEAAASLGL